MRICQPMTFLKKSFIWHDQTTYTYKMCMQSNVHGALPSNLFNARRFSLSFLQTVENYIHSPNWCETMILAATHVVVMCCNGTIKMVKWIRVRVVRRYATTTKIPGAQHRVTDRWSTQTAKTRIHGVSHDSIVSPFVVWGEIQYGSCGQCAKIASKIIPCASEDCVRNYHTASHLVNVSLSIFKVAKMEKEKNVVCALKNIKHRMNFTPYKLIDTTANWNYIYV